MEILIRDSLEAAAEVAASVVKKIINSKENSVLGLATGGTPLRMYHELIRMKKSGELSFQKCTTFNLDEYAGLPREDERSYYYYMMTIYSIIWILTGSGYTFRMVTQKTCGRPAANMNSKSKTRAELICRYSV